MFSVDGNTYVSSSWLISDLSYSILTTHLVNRQTLLLQYRVAATVRTSIASISQMAQVGLRQLSLLRNVKTKRVRYFSKASSLTTPNIYNQFLDRTDRLMNQRPVYPREISPRKPHLRIRVEMRFMLGPKRDDEDNDTVDNPLDAI